MKSVLTIAKNKIGFDILLNMNAIALAYGLGQIVAFLRDTVIAAQFGTSFNTDAYFVALSVPDLFVQLSFAGAIASAIIPLMASAKNEKGKINEWIVINPILFFYGILSLILIILGWTFMPFLIKLLAPGFNVETSSLAIQLSNIVLPTLLFIVLAEVFSSVLNYFGYFFVPALRFLLRSLIIIIFIETLSKHLGIISAALGVMISAVVAAVLLLLYLFRKSQPQKQSINLKQYSDLLKKYFKLALPIMLTAAIVQVVIFLEKNTGSYFETGSVAALGFARKLSFLFINIGPQSLLTVLYPKFSKAASNNDLSRLKKQFSISLFPIAISMCCVSILVWIFSEPITRLIFERGAFDVNSTRNVANLLRWYALGIPIFSINSLFVRVFHSRQKVDVPLIVGVESLILYCVLVYSLPHYIGLAGIPVSLVISDFFRMLILGRSLNKQFDNNVFSINYFIKLISKQLQS